MRKIPGSIRVDRALKGASREVKSATKRVNQLAGKLMARGDYDSAQSMIELGKSVRDFQAQVEELRIRWKALRPSAGVDHRAESTPAWKLYSPILRMLLANGGVMSWRAIVTGLPSSVDFQPLAGDQQIIRGKPRWAHTAYRARGGMVKEGFLEKRGNSDWRITPAGRKAAESA